MTEAELYYDSARSAEKEKKFKEAFILYGLASSMGDVHSLYCLGWYYEYGKGTERDEMMAFYYYRQAMYKGNKSGTEAYNKLKNAAWNYKIASEYCIEPMIKKLAVESADNRYHLKKRAGPEWIANIGKKQLNVNLNIVNPHMLACLASYGYEYEKEFKRTRDVSLYDKAISAIENCYGHIFKVMIENYRRST